MSIEIEKAREDLAFLRQVVEEGGRFQMTGWSLYVTGGLLYGFQCLVQWADWVGLISLSGPAYLGFIIGVNALFVVALIRILIEGKERQPKGSSAKALGAVFSSVGVANVVMCAVFGWVAVKEQSMTIWMLYPPVVFALQGSVWFVAFLLRRVFWHLAVAVGWLGSALALGFLLPTPNYVLVAAVALITLMVGPGLVMMRQGARHG